MTHGLVRLHAFVQNVFAAEPFLVGLPDYWARSWGFPALRILFIVDNRDTVNLDFNYFFANILKLFKKIFTAIHNSINFVLQRR